jgi:protein-S-isoprenylcysteine O-methyltransferase Ste14
MAATRVLGMDRTYFGVELGRCAPMAVRDFPYSLIKHPMFVGNIVALLGFYALPGFREAAPWLVPLHIAFYLLHFLQEEGMILTKPRPETVAAPTDLG